MLSFTFVRLINLLGIIQYHGTLPVLLLSHFQFIMSEYSMATRIRNLPTNFADVERIFRQFEIQMRADEVNEEVWKLKFLASLAHDSFIMVEQILGENDTSEYEVFKESILAHFRKAHNGLGLYTKLIQCRLDGRTFEAFIRDVKAKARAAGCEEESLILACIILGVDDKKKADKLLMGGSTGS